MGSYLGRTNQLNFFCSSFYMTNYKKKCFKNLPLEIALENLDTREERQEFDVVKDDVEAQLNNEVQLIENIKDKLKVN